MTLRRKNNWSILLSQIVAYKTAVPYNRFFVSLSYLTLLLCGSTLLYRQYNYVNYGGYEDSKSITQNAQWLDLVLHRKMNIVTPRLCIIARVYEAQIGYLPVLALSLYHAGLENERLFFVNTDRRTNVEVLNQTVNFINGIIHRVNYITLLDLGEHSVFNDYGYEMTDRALLYLYKNHMQLPSICDYVTFTNGDNFYSRAFGRKIIPFMKMGADLIAWGFVSRYSWEQLKETVDKGTSSEAPSFDDGTQKCIAASLRRNFVDLGAVSYRLAFLQQHALRFRSADGSYTAIADGIFAESAAKRTNKSIILRQTLFVQQ